MSGASVIEAMLLRWGESPSGRTVTFLLPDDGTQHPFKGLKTGPSYGQRVALSVALISDSEQQTEHKPEAAKPPKERKRWDELPLSQQAAIRCNEPDFQMFIHVRFAQDVDPDPAVAAAVVREQCRVRSRRDIRPDEYSGGQWQKLDRDYQFWLQHREAA